jgi:hypothetical protein
MVIKLFLLQFHIFGCDLVKLARQDFQRNAITPQVLSLVFLVSPKNLKFRHETVL